MKLFFVKVEKNCDISPYPSALEINFFSRDCPENREEGIASTSPHPNLLLKEKG